MAVFYKWIKGCEPGADLGSKQWTYLYWGNTATGATALDKQPCLKINTGKNDSTQTTDLGHILTTKMADPTLYSRFNIKSRLWFTQPDDDSFTGYGLSYINDTEITKFHRGAIYQADSRFIIEAFNKMSDSDTSTLSAYTDLLLHAKYSLMSGTQYLGVNQNKTSRTGNNFGDWRIQINEYLGDTTETANMPDGIITKGSVKIRTGKETDMYNNLYVEGGVYLGTQFNTDGTIKSSSATATFPAFGDTTGYINFYKTLKLHNNPVEAPYFNATSDKRAKENIKPATYSALELVKNLPIYNFNYKNNNEKVTGILAQDLLAAQPTELDLVSNINATGKDGDYMSIKNDKLMFVLMKAIQEQQEQIEALKSEIAFLKTR